MPAPLPVQNASANMTGRIACLLSAMLGAAGVMLAAAEAHIAPGTALHSAALLALVTAPACLALVICGHVGLLRRPLGNGLALGLWLGCCLFVLSLCAKILTPLLPGDHLLSGSLQMIASIPMLAPFGGSLMILVWLLGACAALLPQR